MPDIILAIDQGTTSSRAIAFDRSGRIASVAKQEFTQHFPKDGWVEHNAAEIWTTTLDACRRVLAEIGIERVAAIGITNQRETCLFWDRQTGKPLANAIVWQDRRGAELCAQMSSIGQDGMIADRTGLRLDSYFSSTKAKWLLDNHQSAREKAAAGNLLFGTIDTWLVWNLTGGKIHATDPTNACRTMLFNIHEQTWDDDLLQMFEVPVGCLPEIKDSAGSFGATASGLFDRELPILSVVGDQQGALVGQACFAKGDIKSTYGTGCFVLINTGPTPARSGHGLLTSIGYRVAGETAYVLEGSIFNAGTSIQFLRDNLQLLEHADHSEKMVEQANPDSNVIMVPGFTGLGAPHWDPDARGAILGLTRNTTPADIVKAALEAVCFQTEDLLEAMRADSGVTPHVLRADGGMAKNDWLMRFLADVTGVPVERPVVTETTALGAAILAACGAGWFADLREAANYWQLDKRFLPGMSDSDRAKCLYDWRRAVRRTLSEFI